jgi:hypothetical protein
MATMGKSHWRAAAVSDRERSVASRQAGALVDGELAWTSRAHRSGPGLERLLGLLTLGQTISIQTLRENRPGSTD